MQAEHDQEQDRHRLIVAMSISDFFLFLLRHLKRNHIVQFMYLSQLIVDANGVLVLLKFLNQDFAKITGQDELVQLTIQSLLKLMYLTCNNQKERIKANLVQYKATLIMRKLYQRFTLKKIQDYTAKIIRMQIRYLNRNWRKANMKIVSIPYQLTQKAHDDDWLIYEDSQEDKLFQRQMLSEDEIRQLNSDFNYENYGRFVEPDLDKQPAKETQSKEQQLLQQQMFIKMWQRVQLDEQWKQDYEEWLEEEVWTYFD